jgi:glycosyltransferase involved in cell wall biosynthesis
VSDTCVFVSNRAYGITSSRLEIVERFVRGGWRVVVAGAHDPSAERLAGVGAEFVPLPFRRGALSPAGDLEAFVALRRLYRELRPRMIHHFNLKPIVLGGLAARALPGAVVMNTVTGRGYALYRGGWTARLAHVALRRVLPRAAATVFQNSDDLDYFVGHGLVPRGRARLVVSSGVETAVFVPVPRDTSGPPVVLLVGRLVWQKGIAEFAAAAEALRASFPEARFCLAGEVDPGHPDGVPQSWVDARVGAGTLEYLGYIRDMPALLPTADVLVLPSTFGEGVPRVVLEAASCAVPVVASDVPGSREVVADGENGYLVPAGDSAALAERLGSLLADPALRRRMGDRGRRRAVERFDRAAVLERMFGVYADVGIASVDGGGA